MAGVPAGVRSGVGRRLADRGRCDQAHERGRGVRRPSRLESTGGGPVNWWLMALAFVLGMLFTVAFMIRRVTRDVPVYAALGRGPRGEVADPGRPAAEAEKAEPAPATVDDSGSAARA